MRKILQQSQVHGNYSGGSHHLPVFQISDTEIEKPEHNANYTQYYDYYNTNIELCAHKFAEKLKTFHLKLTTDCHTNFEIFSNELQESIDSSCKLDKPITSKRNQVNHPWITPGLISSIKTKQEHYAKWKKSVTKKLPNGDIKLYENFKAYRKKVKKCIKWAKLSY